LTPKMSAGCWAFTA